LTTALAQFFASPPAFFIRQRKEWAEILVDYETKNQYQVMDEGQRELAIVVERAGGFFDFLRRGFLRSHRPLEIDLVDPGGQGILHLSRSFFFFFSDLDVLDADGTKVGSVQRRFGIVFKKYDLADANGEVFARIKSPLWRLWTFPVNDLSGEQRSVITKRWGGAMREVFTDADVFMVDYAAAPWTDEQRATVFAAAISIDFDFFENNQANDGMLRFGGRD